MKRSNLKKVYWKLIKSRHVLETAWTQWRELKEIQFSNLDLKITSPINRIHLWVTVTDKFSITQINPMLKKIKKCILWITIHKMIFRNINRSVSNLRSLIIIRISLNLLTKPLKNKRLFIFLQIKEYRNQLFLSKIFNSANSSIHRLCMNTKFKMEGLFKEIKLKSNRR